MLTPAHFTDARIADIEGGASLTEEERSFLIEDTARMEECSYSEDELRGMGDKKLMATAYSAWVDYCR